MEFLNERERGIMSFFPLFNFEKWHLPKICPFCEGRLKINSLSAKEIENFEKFEEWEGKSIKCRCRVCYVEFKIKITYYGEKPTKIICSGKSDRDVEDEN